MPPTNIDASPWTVQMASSWPNRRGPSANRMRSRRPGPSSPAMRAKITAPMRPRTDSIALTTSDLGRECTPTSDAPGRDLSG